MTRSHHPIKQDEKKTKITITVISIACIAAIGFLLFHPSPTPLPDEEEEEEKVAPVGPAFNADSAYAFTQAQCDFGPRPMNTPAHDQCEAWILSQFKRLGCTVETQKADLKGYDGTVLHSTNIIARYRPEATTRILICAHWDSRPWADNDPDSTNHRTPILAANDAASGVAVMLELARLLNNPANAKAMKTNSSASILSASMLKTGALPLGATCPIRATPGRSEHNTGHQTFRKAMPPATAFYSTW